MVFYVWYRDRLFHREGKLAVLLGGSIFFTVAATLSKENGALLPLILLLLELLFFRLKNADEKFDKGITVSFTLLVVIPFAVVTTWYLFNIDMFAVGYAIRDFTLPERLMTEARAVCYYLQLIVLPSIDELALFHDNFAISRSLNDPPTTLAAVVALTSLLALAVYLARRAPLFSFGILMFFVSHLLESTSLPLELLHEHRNYLGSYGIILSITTLALTVLYRLNSRILIKVIPVLVLLTFSGMTHLRANEWKSNVSLALSEAARNPDSPRATYAAARIYANLVTAGETRLTQQALQRLEIAKQVNTNNISADVALLLFVSRIGLPIEDMWLDQLHYKIAHHPITPSSVAFLKNLVICNRYDCDIPAETLDQLFKAGRNNEFLLRTGKIKADYLTVYADFALNNLGDQELAERLFEEAISIDPAEPQYRINYIRLLVASHRPEEAREHIGALSRLNTFGQLSATIQELNDSLPRHGNAMPTVDQNNMHSRRSHAQPDLRYDY
jgi:tetratricopeptide (TPR) repeat protein